MWGEVGSFQVLRVFQKGVHGCRQSSERALCKGKETKEEQVISLGPQVAEGENVFDVYYIFASFNDAFVHVTYLSGNKTICRWNEDKL